MFRLHFASHTKFFFNKAIVKQKQVEASVVPLAYIFIKKMPINTKELLDAVAILADDQNMRVTLKQTGKGTMICGATCLAGGLLLGPIGLAVGGTLGGIAAALATKGSFKPVSNIIRYDLTERQKQQLVDHIHEALREFDATDLAMAIPLLMGNASIQQAVLRTTFSFISNELRLQIVD